MSFAERASLQTLPKGKLPGNAEVWQTLTLGRFICKRFTGEERNKERIMQNHVNRGKKASRSAQLIPASVPGRLLPLTHPQTGESKYSNWARKGSTHFTPRLRSESRPLSQTPVLPNSATRYLWHRWSHPYPAESHRLTKFLKIIWKVNSPACTSSYNRPGCRKHGSSNIPSFLVPAEQCVYRQAN